MQRRTFLKNAALISAGLIIVPSFSFCNSPKINLDECMGQSESILKNFSSQIDVNSSQYTLSDSQFSHPDFRASEAYVFCRDGKIIGYTLKINGKKKPEEYKDELSQELGQASVEFKNNLGTGYSWQNAKKKFSLSHTRDAKKNFPVIFYSEAFLESAKWVY